MDKLLKILGTIYDTKKRMKAVLGTQSDDICEYPTLIHNYFVDAYNEYYPEGYETGYNDAWTQILGTQPLVPPTTPEQRQKQEYTPNIPTVTEYRDQRLADNLSVIMEEVRIARLGMKEALGTDSDLFVTYPDLLENMIEEDDNFYDKGYEDGWDDAIEIIRDEYLPAPTLTQTGNYVTISTTINNGTIKYTIDDGPETIYTEPIALNLEPEESVVVTAWVEVGSTEIIKSDTASITCIDSLNLINSEWLTFDIKSDGYINFKLVIDMGSNGEYYTLQYNKNNTGWNNITSTLNGAKINVSTGDIVKFRSPYTYPNGNRLNTLWYHNCFSDSTASFDVSGNVMSLLWNDYYTDGAGMFPYLFQSCSVINANNLKLPSLVLDAEYYNSMFRGCRRLETIPILPATVLGVSCYQNMFYGCSRITNLPNLPATILKTDCYNSMFRGCKSITSIPENYLPATIMEHGCYSGMFQNCTGLTIVPTNLLQSTRFNAPSVYGNMFKGCTHLTNLPNLPATILIAGCYEGMFSGCESLTSIPINYLPATRIDRNCYDSMFANCINITSAPNLPANELYDYCYSAMFSGCTKLITPPVISATKINTRCCQSMFKNCTSLTTAPDLLAKNFIIPETGPQGQSGAAICAYIHMFYGCTNLKYIKCLMETVGQFSSDNNHNFDDWLKNVSPTGTFVKATGITWPSGTSGIPTGWTVLEE